MKILAVDQARHGAWALFDYENKRLLEYEAFDFPNTQYTYARSNLEIKKLLERLIPEKEVAAVMIEDIQLRRNIDSFKKLAGLQGVLISLFEEHEYLYEIIAPAKWQGWCNARGRTSKEMKKGITEVEPKPNSKLLSMQFVREQFGIETDNDNIADAICMGWYAVNHIIIREGN